eukprot:710152_1
MPNYITNNKHLATNMPTKQIKINPHAHELFTKHWELPKADHQHNHNRQSYPILACGNVLMQCIHHKPNIFFIENFLSDFEINHLINITRNNLQNFAASYTQSTHSTTQQIYSEQRTSTSLFMPKSFDKIINSIENRAANIVGVNNENVEQLQLVRYTNGQHFGLHHDAGTLKRRNHNQFKQVARSSSDSRYFVDIMLPSRICSLFVYLTTSPIGGGGETYFPEIGLKIRPQRGAAILFCNVDANNIFKADPKLIHS